MAGQNTKKKCLMCQIPIKMLKQHGIRNASLQNVKIYSSKGCRKTSQNSKITNTAILNFEILAEDITSDYGFFPSTCEYFYC